MIIGGGGGGGGFPYQLVSVLKITFDLMLINSDSLGDGIIPISSRSIVTNACTHF